MVKNSAFTVQFWHSRSPAHDVVRSPGDLSHMVKLVAGRLPDRSAPDQALASFTLEQE
jgi:hypothetical protein